jgi:uracil-DNA glycosylase
MNLFAGTRGPERARILIIGEAYGATEERFEKPFMGESGNELSNMLKEAGVGPDECLYTNLINRRPEDNNFKHFLLRTQEAKDEKLKPFRGVFPKEELLTAYNRLHELILHVKPAIIIALGNWALWAVTDHIRIRAGTKKERNNGYKLATGIDTYRGSMERASSSLGSIPVLATYHPAAVLRMWPWRFTAVSDLRRVREYISQPIPLRKWGRSPSIKRWIVPDVSTVETWIEGFFQGKEKETTLELTLDLETYAGKIHLMGLSTPNSTRLIVPFMDVRKGSTKPFYSPYDWRRVYSSIRSLLTHHKVRLLGQNLLYDAQYLHNEFAYVPRIGFDTMVAQHLLWPALRKGLDYMASIYCDSYTYWKEDRKTSLENEDLDLASNYNADDLDYTEDVAEELKKQLKAEGMEQLFSDRMELVEILLDMMIHGVRVDGKKKRVQSLAMMMTMGELISWLEGAIPDYLKPVGKKGSKPWYSSDTKLRTLFYENLELDPIYDKETGEPSLNKHALERLGFKYPEFKPLFGALTLFRSARTFRGTFLDAVLDPDGHWRCAYTITTETGRLASAENVYDRGGNLANIPRDREPLNFYNAIEALS